jgi:catechol 2,3-dioxygenase-like lactoylglutathione lyase family enzyme
MQILGTHHVGLSTANLPRLRAFYVETLGRPVVGAFVGHDIVFVQAGGTVIELIGAADPPDAAPGQAGGFGRRGWQHLAWEVDDVDAAYVELAGRGITFELPPEDFPPEAPILRIAFFADPDGNLIELVQPREARESAAPPLGPSETGEATARAMAP